MVTINTLCLKYVNWNYIMDKIHVISKHILSEIYFSYKHNNMFNIFWIKGVFLLPVNSIVIQKMYRYRYNEIIY